MELVEDFSTEVSNYMYSLLNDYLNIFRVDFFSKKTFEVLS